MTPRFQFSLKWLFVFMCAAAAAAEILRMVMTDRTAIEGLDYHTVAVTILFGIASLFLWGPKVAGWATIALLALVLFLILSGVSP
jgi:hypothetical protein